MNQKTTTANETATMSMSRELTPDMVEKLRTLRDQYLAEVQCLEMLLTSFNAIIQNSRVTLMPPHQDTPYYYIRALSSDERFVVQSCVWTGSRSDRYRYVKGNYFKSEETANLSCLAINKMLSNLCRR